MLSEEKIIQCCENAVVLLRTGHKLPTDYDGVIQGLLDLYEKEKEENRKLRNCHLRYEEITGIDLLMED